jgi:flagellar hook-basal body complex protein FliE
VGQTFNQALDSLSQSQNASDALIQKLAAGENVDLHQVMIASEQTDIRFRVALAMRDKLVEAYHEVMRMQV